MAVGLSVPQENWDLLEHVVTAPQAGVFHAAQPAILTCEGEVVHQGQSLGEVTQTAGTEQVVCPFDGILLGMLARSGERVRSGQPIAWLRAYD